MKHILYLAISLILLSCSGTNEKNKPLFLASSYPVYTILSEIAGDAVEVDYIVPTGASPHTYLPKPSDIKSASEATALFYIAPNFDGWITDVPTKVKIKLIDMVPIDELIYFSCGHDHSSEGEVHEHEHEIDPHFWIDPITVKSIVNELTDSMVKLYPEAEDTFRKNAKIFSESLVKIDTELQKILNPVEGRSLFLHHPSFNYLIYRYGLEYGGAIEESPGKEPSPKFISNLVSEIRNSGSKAIFSEPQLNGKNVSVIADEAQVKVFELNPTGNAKNMKTYRDILIMNSEIIRKALE